MYGNIITLQANNKKLIINESVLTPAAPFFSCLLKEIHDMTPYLVILILHKYTLTLLRRDVFLMMHVENSTF